MHDRSPSRPHIPQRQDRDMNTNRTVSEPAETTTSEAPAQVPAIELSSVTKTFRVKGATLTAVDDVSLQIEPGSVVALLGPNGAGKTTTLDMLLALTTPTSGSISVLG